MEDNKRAVYKRKKAKRKRKSALGAEKVASK